MSIFILCLGIFCIYWACDVSRAWNAFFPNGEIKGFHESAIYFFLTHVSPKSAFLNYLVVVSMIIVPILEIFFSIFTLKRRRWGAIGMFFVSLFWLLFLIFFVSEFLLISDRLGIFIETIILMFLLYLIYNSREYFKQ